MKPKFLIFGAVAWLAAGLGSHAAPKPTLERGWIGGQYEVTRSGPVPAGHKKIVYVKQIYPGTPAAEAGLEPGDVILAWNRQPILDMQAFRRAIDSALPGSHAVLSLSRDKQPMELPITVGREKYQQWHS